MNGGTGGGEVLPGGKVRERKKKGRGKPTVIGQGGTFLI